MATIRAFEKLQVWQDARQLVNLTYDLTNRSEFSRDFALRDQIRRAAISVMSNIAEGLDAGSDSEFIRFLSYSFRSASEVQSQLYTALDQHYIEDTQFQIAYDLGVVVRKQIRGLMSYLAANKRPGRQIRENDQAYLVDPASYELGFDFPIEFLTND